jgi:hypothetical protein
MWERTLGRRSAPSTARKDPEIFCWSFTMRGACGCRRMSHSAWNLGSGPEQLSYAATSCSAV